MEEIRVAFREVAYLAGQKIRLTESGLLTIEREHTGRRNVRSRTGSGLRNVAAKRDLVRAFGYAEVVGDLIQIASEKSWTSAERKAVRNRYVHRFRHIAEDINSEVFGFEILVVLACLARPAE